MASSAPVSNRIEIADPPVPSRSYPVVDKAVAEKLKTVDKRRDKLALKVGSDQKLLLRWTSLRMMRRYLAANRNRPAF
jgi:hypothetical protein